MRNACLAIVCGALLTLVAQPARANVYATDIKLNDSLSGVTNSSAAPVLIGYRLNQAATGGCTISILQNNTVIATILGGAKMGSNGVVWGGTNNAGTSVGSGTYTISITAAATGFTNWTQISVDTNSGMTAFAPYGLDVDKNTNSFYYGRVVMSCAESGGTNVSQQDGLYKMNADGTPADEGWYGNAGYLSDDGGDSPTTGQMPDSSGFNPMIVRIGEDDRIYWCDNTGIGAIIACDITASTNQVVIDGGDYQNPFGTGSAYDGPYNYENNPDVADLVSGIQQFDVSQTTTSNAAVWLVDTGDNPNWGVWMYHLTNGASDPADTVGTQAVGVGYGGMTVTSAGFSVDDNLDMFVSQSPQGAQAAIFSLDAWNGGVLPPEGGRSAYAQAGSSATWTNGANNALLSGIYDTVINSRANPTMVAVAMAEGSSVAGGYEGANGGIAVLNALNGAVLATNLDPTNWYNGVAFDNVGNVYGASRSLQKWRVWSPPGGSTNTTVALDQVVVPVNITITGVSSAPTSGTCADLTIQFTATEDLALSAFTLMSSPTVNGTYSAVGGATVTGGAGTYQVTTTSCSTQFYKIAH